MFTQEDRPGQGGPGGPHTGQSQGASAGTQLGAVTPQHRVSREVWPQRSPRDAGIPRPCSLPLVAIPSVLPASKAGVRQNINVMHISLQTSVPLSALTMGQTCAQKRPSSRKLPDPSGLPQPP